MNKLFTRLLILTMVVAVGLPLYVAPTHAQDDTEALRERALAAYDSFLVATDFVYTFEQTTDSESLIAITLNGETFESNTLDSVRVEGQHTLVTVDGVPNVSSLLGIGRISEGTTNGEIISSNDTTEAELRLVDGVLYASATVTTSEGSDPSVPEGWVIVASDLGIVEDFTALSDVFGDSPLAEIQLSFYELSPEGLNAVRNRRFIETATSITSEALEGDNGEVYDFLTIVIDPAVFVEELSATETDPAALAIGQQLYQNAAIELYMVLDADGNVVGGGSAAVATLDTTDLAAFGVPAGTEGTVTLNFSLTEAFGLEPVADDYVPAEAPTDAVAFP